MNKQLRYLITCNLYTVAQTKQANGYVTETNTLVDSYNVQIQEIDDEVSASVYGTRINNMLRISSPHRTLERYLKAKITEGSDNITKYNITIGNKRYTIISVKNNWVDIEFSCAV